MALSDILLHLDRDSFNNPSISKEELHRRLTLVVEALYEIITQLDGNLLVNENVTVSGKFTPSGRTVNRVAFDQNGNMVQMKFVNGKLM